MPRTTSLAGPAALGALSALFLAVPVTTITQRAISKLGEWAPSVDEMRRDLSASPPPEADVAPYVAWQGMPMHHAGGMDARAIADAQRAGMAFFDGYAWTRATSERWPIALGAVALYLAAIPLLRRVVAARAAPFDVKRFALWWNAGLSLFSWVGLAACAPVLLGALARNGLHFTTCAPAMWYGQGWHGLWVALFVYSKLFELVDTALLLLAGRPVVVLQWWHHATVLLYCWHSYSSRIATGMWFATMNYAVHAVMYGYFACTQHSTAARRAVRPFAIYITLAQLLQMVVGIVVTVASVVYHANGHTCYVSLFNSLLGLVMYSSYFALFLQLFLNHYIYNAKKVKATPSGKGTACPPAEMKALAGAADATNKARLTEPAKVSSKKM